MSESKATTEANLVLDQAARRAAQSVFDRPVVLEAGAGTGKTTALVARVLSWLLGEGWILAQTERPESAPQVVARRAVEGLSAITFTEAAAAEMASRVSRDLGRIARGQEDRLLGIALDLLPEQEIRQHRAQELMGALDRLSIQTIHAFCRSILSRFPLEAGLHPNLKVDADFSKLRQAVSEVIEASLADAEGAEAQGWLELARRGTSTSQVAAALESLAQEGVTATVLRAPSFTPQRLEQAAQAWLESLRALQALFPEVLGKQAKKAEEIRHQTASLIEAIEKTTANPEQSMDWLVETAKEFASQSRTKLKAWSRGKPTKTEATLFGDLDQLQRASGRVASLLQHLSQLQPRDFEATRKFTSRLLGRIEARLSQGGYLLFEHLLIETRQLLSTQKTVLKRIRGSMRQLLVDEFQDTDETQCEIVRLLALEHDSSDEATSPAGPGLFLVGDPKQSIYGWRNADLGAYEGLVHLALEKGGQRYALVRNFRSRPEILEEVDRVFSVVLVAEPGLQPPHQRLEPGRPAAESAPHAVGVREDGQPVASDVVEYWTSWPADPKSDMASIKRPTVEQSVRQEARDIAEDILVQRHKAGARWRDFALLFRSGTHYEAYLDQFRQKQIPFAVAKDRQFYRRREIIEAIALVKTILNPLDHVALVTHLRSASVGLPDAAFIPLWAGHFPRKMSDLCGPDPESLGALSDLIDQVAQKIQGKAPGLQRTPHWKASVLDAIHAIAELRASAVSLPAVEWVEQLRARTLFEVTEAARHLGAFRVANLERFFRTMETHLADPARSVHSVLREVERQVAVSAEGEEAMPKEAAEDAVQVLTIHASKGLEFKNVYLVQQQATSRDDRSRPFEYRRLKDVSTGEETVEYRLLGLATLRFDQVEVHKRRVEQAERVRLLYVAMTRAERRLVLTGSFSTKPTPSPMLEAQHFLDLLAHRPGLAVDLATTEAQAIENRESRIDLGGASFRFSWLHQKLQEAQSSSPAPDSAGQPTGPASGHEVAQIHETASEGTLTPPPALRWTKQQARARRRISASPSGLVATAGEFSVGLSARRGPTDVNSLIANPSPEPSETADRKRALAVGTIVHRALEEMDLNLPVSQAVAARVEALPRYLLETNHAGDSMAQSQATALLRRFAEGRLGLFFERMAPHILGREVPILLPATTPLVATEGPEPRHSATSVLGYISGNIDLVYQDPDSQELVVADFKTDPVLPGPELMARAHHYAPQLLAYATAIQGAFPNHSTPRREIWFLSASERAVLP